MHQWAATAMAVLGGALALSISPGCRAGDATASPEGNPAAGAKWYPVCASCHGERAEGLDALSAPGLAGLPAEYIVRQLNAFRGGQRGAQPSDTYGQQMVAMAAFLADGAAVQDVAAYIAKLPDGARSGATKGGSRKGASRYAACATCHGAAGEGSESLGAPRIAGQSRAYILRQLGNFKTGRRSTGDAFGARMAASVAALSDHELADVAGYVASLRPADASEPIKRPPI